MERKWSTAKETAAFFKVKVPTVRVWTRQGVPYLRCGRLVRFEMESVERWLRERAAQASQASDVSDIVVSGETAQLRSDT